MLMLRELELYILHIHIRHPSPQAVALQKPSDPQFEREVDHLLFYFILIFMGVMYCNS